MNIFEIFKTGISGLSAHKLRTFLTTLGIVFGIAAVIAMLSIGEGAKREALRQINVLGVKNIIVRYSKPDKNNKKKNKSKSVYKEGLTLEDARAVKDIIPSVKRVAVHKKLESPLWKGSKKIKANILGVSAGYRDILSLNISQGSFLRENLRETAERVCVIGSRIKRETYPFENPIGKDLRIGDQWFRIIGVTSGRPTAGDISDKVKVRNMNRDVYIPLDALLRRFDEDNYASEDSEIDALIAGMKDIDSVQRGLPVIKRIMNRRHREKEDYSIIVPEALIRQSRSTQRIFNIVMGCIAGLSLLVGGIGIMNIMLASVYERTREVGIRRAMGALKRDIIGQFLIEAVLISLAGGIIGILLGYALTVVITLYAGWDTIVTFGSVILAFGVSAGVGIAFGIYPAFRASNLDPIEALRYE